MPLIRTKLFAPRPTGQLVPRDALTRRMLEGYRAGRQLTLICAPAGYGKSTAALALLEQAGAGAAWLSLDEGDEDVRRFLTYLAAALREAGVPLGTEIEAMTFDAGMDAVESVLTALINETAAHAQPVLLALDDYHAIRAERVHQVMKLLLERQPPNLHLVIITREDPQLPLARLRMSNRLTEVRIDDLRFSQEEASAFIAQTLDYELDTEQIRLLEERTEGWAAGLQLATLLIGSGTTGQAAERISRFGGTNRYIIDYLIEEVFAGLPAEIATFIQQTSVLTRMNAPLCAALTGRTDAREMLETIARSNLFLLPLDDEREWFRFHHLFADAVRTHLSADERRELNRKAARWMREHNFSYEAVRYAFLADDDALCIEMLEALVREAFMDGQLVTLSSYLDRLPVELVLKSDLLSVRRAIALFIIGRAEDAMRHMALLNGAFYRTTSQHNRGLICYLRAVTAPYMGGDVEEHAREALEYLEPWDPIARTSTLGVLGRAQFGKGNTQEAAETLRRSHEEGRALGYQFVSALASANYVCCLAATGHAAEAARICDEVLGGIRRAFHLLPPYAGLLLYARAFVREHSGELEAAQRDREEGIALCNQFSYRVEATFAVYAPKPAQQAAALPTGESLSEREREILVLLGQGMRNQQIADTLFISLNTTQWHISHIYGKLDVGSRTQALLCARELKLI